MDQPGPPQQMAATTDDRTYSLRIWRTAADQPWRITLRRAGGQAVQHFPSLTALIAALWQQLHGDQHSEG